MRLLALSVLLLFSNHCESNSLLAQSFRSLPIESTVRQNLAKNFPINRFAELYDRHSQSQFIKAQKFQWEKQLRDGEKLTWPDAVDILKNAGSKYWSSDRLRTLDYRVKSPMFAYVESQTAGSGIEIRFVVYNKLSNAIAVIEMERWVNGKKFAGNIGFNSTRSLWAGFNFRKLKNGDTVTYDGGVCITEALSKQPIAPNRVEDLVIVLPARLPPLPVDNQIP